MNGVWSCYRLSDGTFTGHTFSGPIAARELNTPEGCGAIEGQHDHLRTRVDLSAETPTVIDWQPPAPEDDDLQTWGWSVEARAWLPTPTEKALAIAARAERDKRLGATDWSQGTDVPQALRLKWRQYRQALRDVPQQPGFPAVIEWPEPPTATPRSWGT